MFNTFPTRFRHYEVLEELGQGGFGVVYLARDTHLKRLVVLKMLHAHIVAEPDMVKRFLREAQAMARLDHVNIVRVNRVDASHDQQAPFFEMEYVEGSTLSAYRGTRVLSLPEAIPILKQIANALDVAHQQNIIHRDVKPGNVLIKANGELKLTDFGIAKLLEVTGTALSSTGNIIGTLSYMSPEQASPSSKHKIGPGSDIYGLGVVAYELLTGRLPFEGAGHYAAILYAHVNEPPPNPRTFNRFLSPAVANVLLQALAKEPADRYPTAIAFVEALEQAEWVEPVTSTVASATLDTTSAHHRTTASPPVTENRTDVSSNHTFLRMMIGVLVGILVVIIVVGSVVYFSSNQVTVAENTPVLATSTLAEEPAITDGPTKIPADAAPAEEQVITDAPTNIPADAAPATAAPATAAPATAAPVDTSELSCPVLSPTLTSEPINFDEGKAIFYPFSNDHYVLSAADGIYLFNTSSEIRQNLIDTGSHNRDITFSPKGTFLAVAPLGQIELYSAKIENDQLIINQVREPLSVPDRWFSSISFSPDEQLFTFLGAPAGETRPIEAWKTNKWNFFVSSDQPVTVGTVFSPLLANPDVDYWFVSQDNESSSLRVWAVKDTRFSYRPKNSVKIERVSSPHAIEFSPDATKLLIGTESGKIEVIDTSIWGEPQTIDAHDKPIQSLSVSPDSRHVASASEDGSVKVWDITSGTCQYTLPHPENVSSVDFSPDGKTIVTVSGKNAYLWK